MMGNVSHTPGPWEYRNVVGAGLQIRGNPGARDFGMFRATGEGPVCLYTLRKESPQFDFADEIWTQFPQGDWDEMQEANARLIAAAPELLAACEMALDFLYDGTPEGDISPAERSTRIVLMDAIKKAKGGAV